eukprot:gene10037-2356_t
MSEDEEEQKKEKSTTDEFFKYMEEQTKLEKLLGKTDDDLGSQWQWKTEDDYWENYDTPVSSDVEQYFQQDPKGNFTFMDSSKINQYFFDLDKMTETNENTGKVKSIRRKIKVLEDLNQFNEELFLNSKKSKARLFSSANQVNPTNIESYLETLGSNKKRVVYENLMNFGLQSSNGNKKDPLIKVLKDINPIDDSDESFKKILHEVSNFLEYYEKHGDHKIFLKTGNDILIKESNENKPNIEKYLNQNNNIQLKLLSNKKKKLYFSINDCQFNLVIKTKSDGRFRFTIESKEKKLKTWIKNMISFLKSSHLTYISIPAFLSRCIQEFYLEESSTKINIKKFEEVDKDLMKELKEKYIYTWGDNDSTKSELPFIYETNLYIKKQFENLIKRGLVLGSNSNKENVNSTDDQGINVRSPNPFIWFIKFSNFPQDSSIGKDLKIHSKKFNSDENILVEIKFTSDFPQKPPIVRLLSPRFIYSTGNITPQGNLFLDILTPKLWSSNTDMYLVLKKIKENFVDSNARVDLRIQKLYEKSPECSPIPTFKDNIFESIVKFEEEFFAFSSNFAARCFNGFYHNKLENANNLILPHSTAKALRKMNSIEPISMEISTKIFKCYCGVLDFCAPKNSVIVPNWMMKDMMMEEGTKITLKSIDVPLVEMVTFRPLSKSFYNFKNTAVLMTRALRPFVTLYQNQCVPLKVGGNTIVLEVVSFDPPSKVGRIQKNYNEYHDLKINFETAIDFEEVTNQKLMRKNSLIQQSNENSESNDSKNSFLEKTKSLCKITSSQENVDSFDTVQCDNCKKSIRKTTFDIHSIHCKKNFYFCTTCSTVVKKSEEKEHNELSHVTQECKYCSKQIFSILMKQHQLDCQLDEIQDCLYCKLEFSSKEIDTHTKECIKGEHQCENCGFLFQGSMIVDHIQYCKESFYDEFLNEYGDEYYQEEEEETLLNEDLGSIVEGTLACTYCDLQNQTKNSLKEHINS